MTVIYYPGYSQTQVQEKFRVQFIATITNSYPMAMTTIENHGYVAGMIVTFLIPPNFGMTQLNNRNAQVLTASGIDLTLDIDSTNFSIFSYPSPLPSSYTPPSVIPTASGPYLPPKPLPYGNETSFEGANYNDGTPGNPI
jgi:hypothetical protein